jgi:hypothetical protein
MEVILKAHRTNRNASSPRKILKKMERQGLIKFIGVINKEFQYTTDKTGKAEFFSRLNFSSKRR